MKKIMIPTALVLVCALLFSACGKPKNSGLPGRDGQKMTDGKTVFLKEIDSEEFFAANFFVLDNGAKANGKKDDTAAIQKTLDKAGQAGGGTVYLPCGKYKITKPLQIPDNVTMKGDFTSPTAKNPTGKKTTLILADTEELRTDTAISLGNNSAISGFSVKYQKQSSEIREYPFTVSKSTPGKALISDLELINSYRGIWVGGENIGQISLENLYITALQTGIQIYNCSDLLSLDTVKISQRYWTNAPKEKKEDYQANTVASYISENLTAISLKNIENAQLYNIEIDAALRGIHTDIPQESEGLLSITGLSAGNILKVFAVNSLGQNGMAVNASVMQSTGLMDSNIVSASENFKTRMVFNSCKFAGQNYEDFVSVGSGDFSFANCTFTAWRKGAFNLTDGVVSAVNNTFSENQIVGIFENPALGLFYNNSFPDLAYANADYFFEQSKQTEYALTPIQTDDFSFHDKALPTSSVAVFAEKFGLSTDSESNNQALQDAIDSLGEKGGTVLIREGIYRFSPAAINLKPNVKLCGVGNGISEGYVTEFVFTALSGETSAAVSAETDSGISGIRFTCNAAASTGGEPDYAIRAAKDASGIFITDTEISGFEGGVYLENVSGAMLKNLSAKVSVFGVALVNSEDILIKFCSFLPSDGELQAAQKQSLTAITVIDGKKIRMAANSVSSAASGLVLQAAEGTAVPEKPQIVSSGLFLSDVTEAVRVDNTSYAALFNMMLAPTPASDGSAGKYLVFGGANGGKTVIANTAFASKTETENCMAVASGTAELQTSVLRGEANATLAVSGGNLTAGANLFYTVPENHILANGGHTVFMGNLIESATAFAAIEGDYVRKTVSDNAQTAVVFNSKRCDIPRDLDVSEIQ